MKVLLIHGLARTSLSLMGLDRHLLRAGFTPEHFGYLAFAEPFDQIVARLSRRLQEFRGPYAVVAHSLGGLLIRAALGQAGQTPEPPNLLQQNPAQRNSTQWRPVHRHLKHPDPVHVVMLGTPNQRPRLALYAWRALPFRWFTGQCGLNLTCLEFFETLPKLRSPYTLIAGTAGPRGPWSPFGDEVNDGIVALSETWMDPAAGPQPQSFGDTRSGHTSPSYSIQFPVWHTFMMNDPAVQDAVVLALSAGVKGTDQSSLAPAASSLPAAPQL